MSSRAVIGRNAKCLRFGESSHGNPVLVLADDDVMARRALAAELRRDGFVVHEAGSGIEAVEVSELTGPNLILLDTRMPDTDGVQAICDLGDNSATSGVPVIALAPTAWRDEREKHLAAGAVDFLPGPVTFEQVRDAVITCLARPDLMKPGASY